MFYTFEMLNNSVKLKYNFHSVTGGKKAQYFHQPTCLFVFLLIKPNPYFQNIVILRTHNYADDCMIFLHDTKIITYHTRRQ